MLAREVTSPWPPPGDGDKGGRSRFTLLANPSAQRSRTVDCSICQFFRSGSRRRAFALIPSSVRAVSTNWLLQILPDSP